MFAPTALLTRLKGPIGLDYDAPSSSLIASYSSYSNGQSNNFARIYLSGTNVVVTNWSGVHGLANEIKLATVKTTANGFTNGDMFYGTGVAGRIGWLSADGTKSNTAWATLTNETQYTRGGLYRGPKRQLTVEI